MADTDDFFSRYEEWHEAITHKCGIRLTPEYCAERVEALMNTKDPSTREFVRLFGERYRDTVVGWFERAAARG